ncbi:zinc finger protein 558-like [Actinia tenebrosa]|uniref:Zinc finger protein 558-like n=1 Tax=Actinia tenebrosa TaxID=6105 RepID=A0A6P8H2F1_ACTTE|nr:zinc finger protein 558-like [Actinia tenebrosa]
MDCLKCKKVFSTRQRLQYHVNNSVCMKKPTSRVCEDCNKEFSTLQELQQHVKKGICRRTTECSYCGKVLSSRQRLQTHKKKHEERYQYFAEKYNLEGVDCYQCGDLMSRCEHKDDYLRNRIDYFMKISRTLPRFDALEGVPWTNREYWRQQCERCGCVREEEHIFNCLLTKS